MSIKAIKFINKIKGTVLEILEKRFPNQDHCILSADKNIQGKLIAGLSGNSSILLPFIFIAEGIAANLINRDNIADEILMHVYKTIENECIKRNMFDCVEKDG